MSNAVKKWVIELQEFEFSFLVEESTRATLADLLTYKENPVLIKEDKFKKVAEDVKEVSHTRMSYSLMAHIGRVMMHLQGEWLFMTHKGSWFARRDSRLTLTVTMRQST